MNFPITYHFENPEEILTWFTQLPMGSQILYAIIAIALVALALTFVYYVVKGVFWLAFTLICITIGVSLTVAMTNIYVFLIFPIGVLFTEKTPELIWADYKYRVSALWKALFPKKDERNTKVEDQKPAEVAFGQSNDANQARIILSSPEPIPVQNKKVSYHCSNCGAEFTPSMEQIFLKTHRTFCEHCGQRFQAVNSIPVPEL